MLKTARSSLRTGAGLILGSVLAVLSAASPTHAQAPAQVVKNLGPALPHRAETMRASIAFGSEILFGERPGTEPGRLDEHELWKTDGTDAGTVLVKDINPTGPSDPHNFQRLGDTVWFVANDGIHGDEIWHTDGTGAGTTLFTDFRPGPDSSQPSLQAMPGGYLLFVADDGAGQRLWRTDGTLAGTYALTPPGVTNIGIVGGGHTSGDKLFFLATDAASGNEPWVTDGTVAGTFQLADVNPGASGLHQFVFAGRGDGTGYFLATILGPGTSVWKTDGTVAGTAQVVGPQVAPGTYCDNIGIFAMPDGAALFASVTVFLNVPLLAESEQPAPTICDFPTAATCRSE